MQQKVFYTKMSHTWTILWRKSRGKARNGTQWEVAHLLALNFGAPIDFMDAPICVEVEGTTYIHTRI